MTRKCGERARELYQTFVQDECILTDVRTAEMCKFTENSFRDVNIAFANELSIITDKLDINVWELIRLANRTLESRFCNLALALVVIALRSILGSLSIQRQRRRA